jgi:hypothetical protein
VSNLAPKLKFAETLKELKWNILNFIVQSFKLFVGTYITYLKGYDAGFPKISRISINLTLKNILVER